MKRIAVLMIGAVLATGISGWAVAAEPGWPDLKQTIYGDALLTPAGEMIAIEAPYRTGNDLRTVISARIRAPERAQLRSVTLILDENPMPVSAVFDLATPMPEFFFETTMRINGPTPVHVVAETTDGQLIVAETFVKTSGLGACSAPPGTDPKEALASLGNMTIEISDLEPVPDLRGKLLATAGASGSGQRGDRKRKLELDISHPSHSGMQMDQISLLFIPMRYVERVEIDLDGGKFVDVTGSISVSENPHISLSVPGNTGFVEVTMTDTEGSVSRATRTVAGY